MKNLLKAIGAGLALGLALFVVPFVGRLLLFVVLLRVAFRLLSGGQRRGTGRFGGRSRADFGPFLGEPLPIDNQWYRPAVGPAGPASYVVVA